MLSNRHPYFIQSKQQQTFLSLTLLLFFCWPSSSTCQVTFEKQSSMLSMAVVVWCDKNFSWKHRTLPFICLYILFSKPKFTIWSRFYYIFSIRCWIKCDICIFYFISSSFFFFFSLLKTNSNWNPLSKSTFKNMVRYVCQFSYFLKLS